MMVREGGWILSSAQQHALDNASVDAGTPAEVLMESAGRHAAEWIWTQRHPASAIVLAGPGGNGGDAHVVARKLLEAGVSVRTYCNRALELGSPLTQRMAARITQLGGSIDILSKGNPLLEEDIRTVDCIIDGLFGSGLSRPLSGDDAAICRLLNQSDVDTISLDVPSGLGADSGAVLGPTVRADATLAMAFYKPCHWFHPAADACGETHLVGVDYPEQQIARTVPMARVPDLASVIARMPTRAVTGHKGTFGHVLVIAGSRGMTGAAILCARGALRVGAGLVTVALPASIAPVIQTAVPEATTVLLPEVEGRWADTRLLDGLMAAMRRADVIAIGPGLGRAPDTLDVVRRILGAATCKLVVDADAIHALVDHAELLSSMAERVVLTPHPGEFAALVGSTASAVDRQRFALVAEFVSEQNIHLILKGRPTVIGVPDQSLIVNPTGNTGLATGGSGDVLTGMMAGLIAGGSSLAGACVAGPYLHGLVADRWAEDKAERSLLPSDILETLPRILKEMEL